MIKFFDIQCWRWECRFKGVLGKKSTVLCTEYVVPTKGSFKKRVLDLFFSFEEEYL